MAADLNCVVLVGRLTKDPDLRHIPSGTSVCSMRIALSDRVKRSGEWTEVSYYFDVTVWGKQGENCAQYLSKGKRLGVKGRLTWREWEAKDGTKRQAVEIVADSVQFLSPREEGGYQGSLSESGAGSGGYTSTAGEDEFGPAGADDDIPF